MSRVSYAQNHEDVMLARALGDVSEGFYVDVGAQDPSIDSVTRTFYEHGWRGINIEPVPHWFKRLEAERPRDVNLMCAISSETGFIDLYEVSGSGLTTAREEYAREHAEAGWEVKKHVVPTRKLDDIFAEHAPDVVHFLKIDVEGMEHEVLKGFSLRRYRPWILVIEATRPNTATDVSSDWEASVLKAGYILAYRDGLNRFYLAEEELSRLPAFDVPPNIFDDFIAYREHASNDYARGLEGRLQTLHHDAEKLRSGLRDATVTAEAYRTDLLTVTETANAQQASLQERQSLLEEVAARAEAYRTDLLTVTETANAQQVRLRELEVSLQERQAVLEDVATRAESYRTDLLTVTETANAQQARLSMLEASLQERLMLLEETAAKAEVYRTDLSQMRRDLHAVSAAAENRRVLIAALEARCGQREADLRQSQQAYHEAMREIQDLRDEICAIYSSRSWRLTAPMRVFGAYTRSAIGRVLRTAAAFWPLRKLAGWMLRGRLRKRVLALAGFVEQRSELARPSRPMPGLAVTQPERASLSSGGARAYHLLAVASEHAAQDTQ